VSCEQTNDCLLKFSSLVALPLSAYSLCQTFSTLCASSPSTLYGRPSTGSGPINGVSAPFLASSSALSYIRSRLDLELAADEMQQSILLSYHHYYRTRLADSPRKVPGWSVELSKLRANTIRLFNRAKMTGDWDSYKNALTSYNKVKQ
jgi:hypothetical protein